ncbi:hypothetical protein OQA88_12486 [Cercophora sp. LCS_1]
MEEGHTETLLFASSDGEKQKKSIPPSFFLACAKYYGVMGVKTGAVILKGSDIEQLARDGVAKWLERFEGELKEEHASGATSQIRVPFGQGRVLVVKNRPSPDRVDVVVLVE